MADSTAIDNPIESVGGSIEDELGELDALLAELDGIDLSSDADSPISSEDATDNPPLEGDENIETITIDVGSDEADTVEQPVESVTTEETAESNDPSAQDEAALETTTEQDAKSVTAESAEQDDFKTIEDEEGDEQQPDDASESPESVSPESLISRVIHWVFWLLVEALTIIDKPFSYLPLKFKRVVGYVAIATLLTAIPAWILADFVR